MKTEREKAYQYWLLNIKGIGRKKKIDLTERMGSAEIIYGERERALRAAAGEKAAEKILEARKNWDIFTEYEKLQGQKIKFACYGDRDYPKRLAEIPDAPFAVYYQGNLPADGMPSVAIIGARACSEYGIYAAKEFGSKLAGTGIQIISGLAMGIDGIAQEAALLAGGKSFGVLGSGVDICYPKSNRSVYERCKKQGGILSEYPPGTKPAARLFPQRNRLISGLSDVILVIEAREKSGTLITVDMALEQGKEVFALPGRITDSLSRGCHQLFRQGAAVAAGPCDILEAVYGVKAPTSIEETVPGSGDKRIFENRPGGINILSEQEKQVYGCLEILPRTPEEIYGKMDRKIAIQEVMCVLVELCIKGFARQCPEGYCQKALET